MKATVTVFVSETSIQLFEPTEERYEFVHPDDWSYDRALRNAERLIKDLGMKIESEYFERNEFDDPITCYFVEA